MARNTHTPTPSAEEQLVKLFSTNPSLRDAVVGAIRAQVIEEMGMAQESAEPIVYPDTFDFELVADSKPTASKSGKTLKYELEGFATDSVGTKHKALLVAYLPPEVAPASTKSIFGAFTIER